MTKMINRKKIEWTIEAHLYMWRIPYWQKNIFVSLIGQMVEREKC